MVGLRDELGCNTCCLWCWACEFQCARTPAYLTSGPSQQRTCLDRHMPESDARLALHASSASHLHQARVWCPRQSTAPPWPTVSVRHLWLQPQVQPGLAPCTTCALIAPSSAVGLLWLLGCLLFVCLAVDADEHMATALHLGNPICRSVKLSKHRQ